MLIPGHLFPRDREDTADIDWQASSLQSSGHSFVRIRVAKPEIAALRNRRVKAPKIKQTASPLTLPVPLIEYPFPRRRRKRWDDHRSRCL